MTPQFILKAGIRDYLKEFIQKREMSEFEKTAALALVEANPQGPFAWRELEQERRMAHILAEDLDWSNAYAEPGYTDPKRGILFANWNHVSRRTYGLLEKAGYECEWSDEWSRCDDCGNAVRTSPDSYGWSPAYVIFHECEIVCKQCLLGNESAMRDYLEELEDDADKALQLDIDPAKYGYVKLEGGLESGFHPGQDAKPKAIAKRLRDSGETRPLLFKIDGSGQFDMEFSVWARVPEEEDAE